MQPQWLSDVRYINNVTQIVGKSWSQFVIYLTLMCFYIYQSKYKINEARKVIFQNFLNFFFLKKHQLNNDTLWSHWHTDIVISVKC